MKHIVAFTLALLLPVLVMSCTDEAIPTASVDEASVAPSGKHLTLSSDQVSPHSVLGGSNLYRNRNQAAGKSARFSRTAHQNGFASPLFGLATAPNRDILVADAGAGVATLSGITEIPLPGVTDIAPIGRGSMWATKGLMGAPGEDTGQALYLTSKGKTRQIADLFAFEEANNPDGADIDSNPFDAASLGGRAALVADAGANVLLQVNNQGHVDVLAVFPSELVSTANIKALIGCPNPSPLCGLPGEIPAQAVPTSVAVGPDGYYYVGELKGFPAPSGESNIWRIAPDASGVVCGSSPDCVKVFDGGFTSIIDLTFGPDGSLYVAELDEQSWFAVEVLGGGAGGSINSCDLGTLTCNEVATGIPILTAITLEDDGTLWATKNALLPDLADVIEVP